LTDGSVDRFQACAEPLKTVKAPYGKFFVTGNHEYISSYQDEWIEELKKYDIKSLRNEHVSIERYVKQEVILEFLLLQIVNFC
jgi:predicted MPP superfamily phosphohydrolase